MHPLALNLHAMKEAVLASELIFPTPQNIPTCSIIHIYDIISYIKKKDVRESPNLAIKVIFNLVCYFINIIIILLELTLEGIIC